MVRRRGGVNKHSVQWVAMLFRPTTEGVYIVVEDLSGDGLRSNGMTLNRITLEPALVEMAAAAILGNDRDSEVWAWRSVMG